MSTPPLQKDAGVDLLLSGGYAKGVGGDKLAQVAVGTPLTREESDAIVARTMNPKYIIERHKTQDVVAAMLREVFPFLPSPKTKQ